MKQALRYNNKVIKKIYQGDELVKKMNYGQSSDVFQYIKNDGDTPTPPAPVPYNEQYLTIETLTAGNLSLANAGSNVFNYSLNDGSTWNRLANGQTIAVEANKKVLFKAQGLTASTIDGIGTINYTGNFNVYGNVMSLVHGDNFIGQETMSNFQFIDLFRGCTGLTSAENLILPAISLMLNCYQHMFRGCTSLTTAPELPALFLADYCYQNMFNGCTSLTTAPELPSKYMVPFCYQSMFYQCTSLTTAPELPALNLANECYWNMFNGCTSLTTAPQLPATTLKYRCYQDMFRDCVSLTTAPQLPATTLTNNCYYDMFYGCTNLTTAPELPALNLANTCYGGMFFGCTSLNYIKAMFTTTPSNSYTFNWVKGVASSGTFVKNAAATWNVTSTYGIPSGWTVVDA